MSRVRNLSRVAITGSAGFGLLEVLVASVVGTILISGSAKFMQITLQTSNVAKSILIENDFKATIAQGLKDKGCASSADDALLKPASLKTGTTTDDGIGEFKDAIVLPGGIQKGDFKGSIEVIKMELRGVAGDDTRDFVVYYKKKHLGTLSAPDPENCTDTPAVKVTGCYNHYCTVAYNRTAKHCTGSVNCHSLSGGGGGLSEAEVNTLIKDRLKTKRCPTVTPPRFAKGFYQDPDGNLEIHCEPTPPPPAFPAVNCPNEGEFLKGFTIDANGVVQADCQETPDCAGGKELKSRTQRRFWWDADSVYVRKWCECPSGSNWNGKECITCPEGQKFVSWDIGFVSRDDPGGCFECDPSPFKHTPGGLIVGWHYSIGDWNLPSSWVCACPYGKKKLATGFTVADAGQVGMNPTGYVARQVRAMTTGYVARQVRAMTTGYVARQDGIIPMGYVARQAGIMLVA